MKKTTRYRAVTLRVALAGMLAVALAGCDDDATPEADMSGAGGEGGQGGEGGEGGMGGGADAGGGMGGMGGEGGAPELDDGVADQGNPDQGNPDQGIPDQGNPDQELPDQGTPDQGADLALPDMAVAESPIDCARLCPSFQAGCPEAFAIHGDCADCELLSAAYAVDATEPLRTAAEVCIDGIESGDCRALYTCLVDPDGLHAVGTGVTIEIHGTVGDQVFDFVVDDAYAAVGLKNDGSPSDLELSFITPDGDFLAVKFDDLPAAIGMVGFGLLEAADNEVQVEIPGNRVDLDNGLIEVTRFSLTADALPAGFELSAEVRPNLEVEPVIVRARGTFE